MQYTAPVRIRVEKDIITRVIRVLRGKGQLSVQVGQQVEPADIIGNSTISSGFRILNLSKLLDVSPKDVQKYLARGLNQRIYQGELLALRKGSFLSTQKMVISPTDGILDFLNNQTGELRIAFIPKEVKLPAGVYGIVEKIDGERGIVVIKTQASRIYGLAGSGKNRDGILHILGTPDSLVSKSEVGVKYDSNILVGGSLFFKDAISAAISSGVEGLITGGIDAADYKKMAGGRLVFPTKLDNDIGIGVVVCEGFGSIPIGEDIFEQLKQYEGKFVFIDGNKALINLPSTTSASLTRIKNTHLPEFEKNLNQLTTLRENAVLKVGQKVRVVGNAYPAEIGKLVAIDESATLLPSGIKTNLATVEGSRRKIQVPVANLEIIV